MFICRWLLLLPAVAGLYHLGFELCSSEKPALFYEERLTDDRTLAFFSLFDCLENSHKGMAESAWTLVRCNKNKSHADLHFKGQALDEFLRAGQGRLASCKEGNPSVEMVAGVARVRLDPDCEHYEPRKTDPARVYLVCDGRLGQSPLLLIVTSVFRGPYGGHLIEAAFWGWHIGLLFVVLPAAVYFILRETRQRKKKKTDEQTTTTLQKTLSSPGRQP